MDSAGSKRFYTFTFGATSLLQVDSYLLNLTPEATTLPRGLAFDGTYFWLADQSTDLIYQFLPDGTSLGAIDAYDGFSSSSLSPTGLAFIDGDLWVADRDATTNMLYNLSSFHTQKAEFFYANRGNEYFRTQDGDPMGILFEGSSFWMVDGVTNTIYTLDPSGSVLGSCVTPGSDAWGIASDGTNLFVTDAQTDLIYTLDPADCSVLSSFSAPGPLSRGLVFDGVNLWVADSQNDMIYKLDPSLGTVLGSFSAP